MKRSSNRGAWLAAVLALAALPAVAHAGPISWDYTGTLQSTSTGLYAVRGEIITNATIHVYYTSTLAGAGGSARGSSAVAVGTVTPDSGRTPDWFESRGLGTEFELNLTIRDAASGRSGSLRFIGSATETDQFADEEYLQPTSRTAFAWLTTTPEQDLVLGENGYHVSVTGVTGAEGTAVLEAAVSVSPAAAAPEPGTLALTGLGLGAVGLRRRRKD